MSGVSTNTITTFGELLRYLRRRARLTQRELSIAVGYSDVQIARLEKNQRLPDVATVQARFIEALDIQDQPDLAARLVNLAATAYVANSHKHSPEPLAPPSQQRTNLRVPLTRFIGRVRDIETVKNIVTQKRLVTLTGAGGVGKTRLAIEVGTTLMTAKGTCSTFPDGVWLVELAPLTDPALVPQITASVFGLTGHAERSPLDQLIDCLEHKQLLLIMDNCEHLALACAELAEALLRDCPRLHILATSREPLRAAAEVVWRVPSLSAPDPARLPLPPPEMLEYEAVQLFVERAATTRPGFAPAPQDLLLIAQVCLRLDGIPLAIELAAACLNGLSLSEIAAHLDDRFTLLTTGQRTALPRHQTLKATLDWSYDLLSASEQALLGRLSVFAGGWTAEAVQAVCSETPLGESDILPLLLNLVSKSLVIADEETRDGGTRYRLLETIRQYAADRLLEAGQAEIEQLHSWHLDYYLAQTHVTEPFGQDTSNWLGGTEQELDNYRAALGWSMTTSQQDERGLHLVWALENIWFHRGHLTEGAAWLSQMLAKWTAPTALRARALDSAGLLNHVRGDMHAAAEQLTECIQIARALDDKLILSDALLRLFGVLNAQGDTSKPGRLEQSYNNLSEALRLGREIGHRDVTAFALCSMAQYMLEVRRPVEARQQAEEALALFTEAGNDIGTADALGMLAACAVFESDWATARSYYERMMAIVRKTNNAAYGPRVFLLALTVREQGDNALAIRQLEESYELYQQLGVSRTSNTARLNLAQLGRTLFLRGDTMRAQAVLDECLDLCRDAGDNNILMKTLSFMAALALDQRDFDAATRHYRKSLQLARTAGDLLLVAVGLAGMAEVARLNGDIVRATKLCGNAATLGDIQHHAHFRTCAIQDVPADWLEYGRTMVALRAQLGDPALAAAWAEGQAMTMQQAVEVALAS